MENQNQTWLQRNLRTVVIAAIIVTYIVYNQADLVQGWNKGLSDFKQ